MPSAFNYSYHFLFFVPLWWAAAVFVYWVKYGKIKFGHFGFSLKKYFILSSIFLAYPLWWTIANHSIKMLVFYAIFAFGGMLAEALLSAWWKIFYRHRFYVYTVETVDHAYTSWLNPILWGYGGFFFLALVGWINQLGTQSTKVYSTAAIANIPYLPFYAIFFPAMVMLIALVLMIFHTYALNKTHDWQFPKATLGNYLFTQMPFMFPVVFCALAYGPFMFQIWLAFGLLGSLGEYLLGKVLQFFVSKKFWTYNYWSTDNGHFTPLSIPGFAFLGFYFWSLALIFEALYN